ncbi:MAG: hypothetical protein LBO21_02155 [Synergistaceae bacterium]|nr:hypothetical protein [Synergistaceae bacterium]
MLVLTRETLHIFDLVLKQLIRLSSEAVIQFINGLFGTNHPLDSSVEYPNTENVSKKLRRLMSDTVIIINGVHVYHIEGEISGDADIALRVFEYGFAEGLRARTPSEDGRITIRFPNARIIYWEITNEVPDEVMLSLEFPDGGRYDYKVKAFKFLKYSVKELEERKMAILLPFYVLKLRKRTVKAKTPDERSKLAGEMRPILENLVTTVESCTASGLMNESDKRIVLEHMERLYRELFGQYEEFTEVDTMLRDRVLTYSEEAELKGRQEGRQEGKYEMAKNLLANGVPPEIIAKSSGMSLDALKTLMN